MDCNRSITKLTLSHTPVCRGLFIINRPPPLERVDISPFFWVKYIKKEKKISKMWKKKEERGRKGNDRTKMKSSGGGRWGKGQKLRLKKKYRDKL
jgi:hypothetical protein